LIASDIKLDSISQEFNIEKGVLQSFQHSATIMANQSAKFAEMVGILFIYILFFLFPSKARDEQ